MAKKILLVDDDEVILQTLQKGLQSKGYEILSATDGGVAIDIARSQVPDLIILDVLLPTIDGTEVSGRLQEDYRTCHIPVIYLTGLESKENAVVNEVLGQDVIFTKPVDFTKLLQKIQTLTAPAR